MMVTTVTMEVTIKRSPMPDSTGISAICWAICTEPAAMKEVHQPAKQPR